MRVVVFSERLRAPYDEGIKNFAVNLIGALRAEHEVLALTSGGANDTEHGIKNIDVNRLLLSRRLRAEISGFQPLAILYVPTACGTVFSFARARILHLYGQRAQTVLVTVQPRPYTALGRWLVGHLAPSWVMAQSRRTVDLLRSLGCRTSLLPPAVDSQRFCPASPTEKAALREKHAIPHAATVIAHVGHLEDKRGLSQLAALQAAHGYHVIVVGSTSTRQDAAVKQVLRSTQATVVDTYVPRIEDIYHLSDVYLFLAEDDTAAIELPLSILEAMACNLPVVCTPFGGLPDFFKEGAGFHYWRGQTDIVDTVSAALSAPCTTRALVESRTWPALARALLHPVQESGATR